MKTIQKYRDRIHELCIEHNVDKLFVSGSILRPSFNENSDVDFLVDFLAMNVSQYADNYFNFKFSLEELLKRKVDVIERKALRNPYLKKEVESTKSKLFSSKALF